MTEKQPIEVAARKRDGIQVEKPHVRGGCKRKARTGDEIERREEEGRR